jgi:hypothetical protein
MVWLHLDKNMVHSSEVTMVETESLGLERLVHPSHSPDVPSSDFFFLAKSNGG